MPTEPERLRLRVLRKDDLIDLTFELVNLRIQEKPLSLVQIDKKEPALLIVHFPPQHIIEEVFGKRDPSTREEPIFRSPVPAILAGTSRLVFELPNTKNEWPLTVETLLNWKAYEPKLAAQALPPGEEISAESKAPAPEETALEIPTGLYLSPDKYGEWLHSIAPVEHEGRVELWHTRLHSKKHETEGSTARIIWTTQPDVPFPEALSNEERNQITRLSSDFSLPQFPFPNLQYPPDPDFIWRHWRQLLTEKNLPLKYVPNPITSRRLMLSSLGAWANLESSWNYPTILKEVNDNLGYPIFNLEQWQHIIAQARDQYVKTVTKAFLIPTGHRVSIVTITERKFHVDAEDGNKLRAYLKKTDTLELQEPMKDYSGFKEAFTHEGREMPLKKIHITTTSTPALENLSKKPFWPMVNGQLFHFQMTGEDVEGNTVFFESPLYCVPVDENLNWEDVKKYYNEDKQVHRSVFMHEQSIAFGETDSDSLGKTSLNVESLDFEIQSVTEEKKNVLTSEIPLLLPCMRSAQINLPSVKELLGRPFPTKIEFDQNYLDHGFDAVQNKGEVFMKFTEPLNLAISAEKAGGLIKPDSMIEGLSRSLGVVNDIENLKKGTFDLNVFDKARFLGGITLKDILQEIKSFDIDKIKSAASMELGELMRNLEDPEFHIEVPMLTTQTKPKNNPSVIETRFLWKPILQNYPSEPKSFFYFLTKAADTNFDRDTQLTINALLVTPFGTDNQSSASFNFEGHLKEFALDFVGAMKLTFTLLRFRSANGRKMEIDAQGMDLKFQGPLTFVNTLKDILPVDGFSDPPYLDVTASGIRAGYTLGIPSVGVGVFNLQNLSLNAGLTLPFLDQPAGIRFSISERQKPFLVTVGLFGGSGFFSIVLSAKGIQEVEAAIEFGGNISLNLGVASGGVQIMAGIYFAMDGNEVKLSGYLRCGGHLNVLGLISITVEFYLGFDYLDKGKGRGEVWGQASLTIGVKIAFFSKSVTLKVERRFAGAAGDPTFADLMGPDTEGEYPEEWDKYCSAFA
ncbi:hypothetical protein ACSFXN_18235 [Planococcus sp. 1R117A]|uniref:hypothetical protein n=1 Tax=Planococcus sp. 1R117A TaxID=3447020 RepID=UPI003EDBDF03